MYLIFNSATLAQNQNDFDTLNQTISQRLGYPNEAGTLTYADPVYHPDGIRIAIAIDATTEQYLTSTQQSALVSGLSSDWYPAT